MEISQPQTDAVDLLADFWVELATDQRQYGSRLLAVENRQAVAETIVRHIVSDGVLVASEDDEMLGFVMYTLKDGRYVQDEQTGVIVNLYVRAGSRNRGVGSKLLAAAETELAELGAETVSLEVLAANDDARRFYRRHDYRPHRLELTKSMENDTHSKGGD